MSQITNEQEKLIDEFKSGNKDIFPLIIDNIKYGKEKIKRRVDCKKGKHSPNIESWYDRAGYVHSHCYSCGAEIFKDGTEWKAVVK